MIDFEIIKQKKDKIISLKRLSDNTIFTVGDLVGLTFQIENGLYDDSIIIKFMTESNRSHKYFSGDVIFPVGTIVTKTGIIQLPNVSHIDKNTENYILKNTECLSIKDLVQLLGHKLDNKKLLKFIKNKLSKH